MTWDDRTTDFATSDGDRMLLTPIDGPCHVCRTPCHWASVSFEAAVCSPECYEALGDRHDRYVDDLLQRVFR